ncbi:hypothetical protein ACKWTF_006108 [Chironomus riparius]
MIHSTGKSGKFTLKMVELLQRDPFRTIFKYFKYYGMWTDVTVRHRTFSIIAFLVLNLSCCILIILSLFKSSNIEEFTRCTIYGSLHLISLSCNINFNIKKNAIRDFIDDLNQVMNDDPEVMNDFAENGLRKCNRMFNFTFHISYIIIGAGTIIEPLVVGKVSIPMLVLNKPDIFYISWIFQMISSFYTIYMMVFNVELFGNLLIMFHTYIEYFGHNLRNLKATNKEELVRCVKIHWNIMRLMEKNENIVHTTFAAFGFFGMTMLCSIAFLLSTKSISDSRNLAIFIHYGGREFILTAQVFRACYFAQQIQSSSEEFIVDLYANDWTTSDHKYKKMMLIFNENLQQPITMRIFKTFNVNLETFQSILNVVYSLYTLLKNLKH